jgi:hypothetical protein
MSNRSFVPDPKFQMTMEQWIEFAPTLKAEDLIMSASTRDGSDSATPFPIGVCKFAAEALPKRITRRAPERVVVTCNINPANDQRRRGWRQHNRANILDMLQARGIHNVLTNPDDYLNTLGKSAFVISPEGNGIDCHRHYEALIMGAIPIVEYSPLAAFKYQGCPIIFTKYYYADITVKSLAAIYPKLLQQTYDFSALMLSCYTGPVRQEIDLNSRFWMHEALLHNMYEPIKG